MRLPLTWLEAARPKTLPAALCPVVVASGLAFHHKGFEWQPALICLLFALLIQIGTNFANDYLDGVRGTDDENRIGPRRAVASGLIAPGRMKSVAISVLALAFFFGLLLIPFGGWWLLSIGIASVLCAWLYTGGPYPLAYNALGDVFVVLFFGFIAVGCTYYVQTGTWHGAAAALGLACGLIINNLLVVNNYRDVEGDRLASKRTLVVLLGKRFGLVQYLGSCLVSLLILLFLAFADSDFTLLLGALPLFYGALQVRHLRGASSLEDFNRILRNSGLVVAAFGVLTSIGLVL